MAQAHGQTKLHLGKFVTPSWMKILIYVLIALGVVSFGLALFRDSQRAWTSFLTAFFFFTCLGVGGLFFAAINHIAKAGWSVTVRI